MIYQVGYNKTVKYQYRILLETKFDENLGYVKLRGNKPYYGYSKYDATVFNSEEQAKEVYKKFSNNYLKYLDVDTY